MIIPMIGLSQQRVSIEYLTDSFGTMYGSPSVEGVRYGEDLFTGIAYIEIDDNQLVAEYNYKNGVLHGFKIWYDSGKLKEDGNCIDGDVNKWTMQSWYKNGNLHRKENMSNIKKGSIQKGSGTEWYDNGQLKEEVIFEDGVMIKIACWDLNGGSIDCSQTDGSVDVEAADDYIEDEAAYVEESNVDEGFENFTKDEKLSNLLFLIIFLSLF